MKTSRVAYETAKVITNADFIPQRQTRSSVASLKSFSADDLPLNTGNHSAIKQEDVSNDDSSLSSLAAHDIEDIALITSPRKRKRGMHTPSTALTTISTSTSTRTSPRKAAVKDDGSPSTKIRRARRQPAKREVNEAGEVEISAPANWEEIYDAVVEMRKDRKAPVDTMGCETLAEGHLTPRDKRFQTLIALMLSSQTKDTTNAIAMRRLQTDLPHPGLTLENILAVKPDTLNEMIFVVGFHNNKTRYIKAAAQILRDRYDGDIPDTIEGLMGLPGVGPKMAYLCMSAAWGRTEGIGVDVHVHRITNLWGWHKTKGPEETRGMLEAWLPRDRWHEINHLLVGFGQTMCLPVGRKCGNCTLSQKGLCPSADVDTKVNVKRIRKETTKNGESTEVKVEELEATTTTAAEEDMK